MIFSADHSSSRWSGRVTGAAAMALPALVWFLGSFYFLGQLGKWIDDYGAHVRDPATGAIKWGELFKPQWWFFWRPIHIQIIYTLQTLFYNHDWLNHLFGALMHALACFGLWKFLRTCGLRPVACAVPALVMLGSVQGFEAILWPATVSTSIATATFFWAASIVVGHARGRRGAGAVVALGVLGFAVPCMYEQPAAALAGLPILYLGAGWRRGEGLTTIRRMVVALAPCGVAVAAYLVLFVVTVRQDPMAREAQFSQPELLWPHMKYLLTEIGALMLPMGGLSEVWYTGVRTLRESALGMFGWAAIAGAAMGAWVWAWWPVRGGDSDRAGDREEPPVHGLVLIALGAAGVALAMVPIVAISGAGISPRLVYFPLACALIGVGGLFDVVLRMVPAAARPMSGLVAIASGVVAIVGSIHLVGVQAHMRHRYAADQVVMASLRKAVPNPTAGTVLVPVTYAADPVDPKIGRMGSSFGPIWSSPWGINTEIKRVYGRNDVEAAALYADAPAGAFLRVGDPTMIAWSHLFQHLPTPRKDPLCPLVPVARLVPYSIRADGSVTLVRAIDSKTPDGRPVRVEFPQVVEAAGKGVAVQDLAMQLPIETGRPWLTEWTWLHRMPPLSPKVKFQRVLSWGAADCAARMHPPVPGATITDGDTDVMEYPLAPGGARRFVFHATLEESTIDLSVLGDGVDIRWSVGEMSLKTLRLNPVDVKAKKVWETVTVDVPASTEARMLRVTVGPGPKGNPSYDRVVVTCGEEELSIRNAGAEGTQAHP